METTDIFRDIVSSHIRNNGGLSITNTHIPPTNKTPFIQHAIQLRNRLQSIELFILRISQSYILVKPLLWSENIGSYISDNERIEIDENIESQLYESNKWLDQLKEEVKKQKLYTQTANIQAQDQNRITSNDQITLNNDILQYHQNIVLLLLTRLSLISKKVGRLQTAHYEAVLTSQSPFAAWIAIPIKNHMNFTEDLNDNIYDKLETRDNTFPLSQNTFDDFKPSILLHVLSTTLSETSASNICGRVISKGCMNMKEWAYAVLLTVAHQVRFKKTSQESISTFTSACSFLSYFDNYGSIEMLLRESDDSVWMLEWERVQMASLHCWHWKELYQHFEGKVSYLIIPSPLHLLSLSFFLQFSSCYFLCACFVLSFFLSFSNMNVLIVDNER